MAETSRTTTTGKARRRSVAPTDVEAFVERTIGEDLHARRVLALRNGVIGVLHAATLGVHAIGLGLSAALNTNSKHAIKQIDRLLSNAGIDVWDLFEYWVPFVVAQRPEAVVVLDWTDFDKDDQTTLAAYLVTNHGRATPLMWMTVPKSELKGQRNDHEDVVLGRLADVMPRGVRVTVLADRAFGDQKLYAFLQELGWDYIIRFRECITVRDRHGTEMPAADWVLPRGRARMLKDVEVTADRTRIPAFVCVHAKGMKDAWCIATSRADLGAAGVVSWYGRRFTIEETFRDAKDIRFGMALSSTRISTPERRDRLLLLAAMAQALLTLLGAASEAIGYDRLLKANTVKKRTHSLFRQGSYWFTALPNMDDARLRPLMEAFSRIVAEHRVFREIFAII